MSQFDRTNLPHPYLPAGWGSPVRPEREPKAPALPNVNPGLTVLAMIDDMLEVATKGIWPNGTNLPPPDPDPDNPWDRGPHGPWGPGDGNSTFRHIFNPLPGAITSFWTRARGGTATLIGYSEFTDPSSPPKKYLNIQSDHCIHHWDYFDGLNCVGGGIDRWSQTNGAFAYDPVTGSKSGSAAYTTNYGGDHSLSDLGPWSAVHGIVPVNTQTTSNGTITTGVCYAGDDPSYSFKNTAISGTVTLSNEDTEQNAVNRLLATLPAWDDIDWNEFADDTSIYELRTTGFSFAYQQAQARFAGTGTSWGWTYGLTVGFQKREYPYGAAWEDYSELTYMVIPNHDGSWECIVTLPNLQGYEVRVKPESYVIAP